MMVFYCFSPELKFLICRKTRYSLGKCLVFSLLLKYRALKPLMPKLRGDKPPFRLPMIAQCKIMFSIYFHNLEPTAKGSVLKFDKFIYSKSINSEQGDKPLFLGLDKTIIVRPIVWPFAYAQGVQSSLTLGRNIIFYQLFTYTTHIKVDCILQYCSPILFTQASHRCLPSVGIGSAWANWLAYNIGMARLLWSGKSINIILLVLIRF